MTKKNVFLALAAVGMLFTSCNKDDAPSKKNLTINITGGLEALGSDYVYEGWIIVNDAPISTGTFSDVTTGRTFEVDAAQLDAATKFVLSIEPAGETGTAAATPSKTKILAGDFSGNTATIDSKIVGDFSASWGKYILATPTNGANTDERSGVWFLAPGMPPAVGLGLPTLGEGWKYEGWAVIDGKPISTGKFTKLAATDESAAFSGPTALPSPNGADGFFPGEDFLLNAPDGVTFPTDLRGATIVISVEPEPDNSSAPFALKPLANEVSDTAVDHVAIDLGDGPKQSISGTVTR